MGGSRIAAIVAGALIALGFPASSAPSPSAGAEVVIELATAGPGTVTISPAENESSGGCKTIAQQYESSQEACIHHYAGETRVTLEAVPDKGRSFAGWSDFGCKQTSTRCTLKLTPGTRNVSAWFSPVTLRLFLNEPNPGQRPFGLISADPKPSGACALNDGDPCQYPRATFVTLKREFAAPGFFWIGACEGNREGKLDANTCRLRVTSDEAVGVGYREAGEIPPPLGSGIAVVVSGRGKVTGSVINGTETLSCGARCVISGLDRYDYVRLVATASKGSRFSRWNNRSTVKTQVVPMSSVNRIQAVFRKK